MMGLSWSAMRRILEQENICDALKGRIRYFATRYRRSHDQTGRVTVRLVDKELFSSCFYTWQSRRDEIVERGSIKKTDVASDWWGQVLLEAKNLGGFDQYGFYEAFYEYQNQSIEASLASSDPVVRMFAVLDKRTGKRRLQKLRDQVELQPKWLRIFYILRLDAEGMLAGM